MKRRNGTAFVAALALAAAAATPAAAQPAVEIVAEGLHAPRGLAVADDGSLLVAEAGQAGDECPMGEAGFCFGPTGSVARIVDGSVERVIEGLTSAGSGPEVVGPSDVAFKDDGTFYLLLNGGGDPAERPDGDLSGFLLGANVDGTYEPISDVWAFEAMADPDAEYSGGVLDANPHSVAVTDDGVVIADAGSNSLLAVDDAGEITVIAVFPPREHLFPAELMAALGPPPETDGEMAAEGDAMAEGEEMAEGEAPPEGGMVPVPVESVPTTVVVGPDGAYYVGELTGGPFPVGGAIVWRVVPGEEPTPYATGLTNVIDLGFGPDGSLFVAEIVHEGLMPVFMGEDVVPIGAVMRVAEGGGEAELLASGEDLMALGGLAVAEDGSIYVSANTLAAEGGTIVKITP
jgi:DNA-binding beta-propeller fold protein YncE